MKKYKILVLALLLVLTLFMFLSCDENQVVSEIGNIEVNYEGAEEATSQVADDLKYRTSPPMLNLELNNSVSKIGFGTCSWDYAMRDNPEMKGSVIACGAAPEESASLLDPISRSNNRAFKLSFDIEPQSASVRRYRCQGDRAVYQEQSVYVKDGAIVFPDAKYDYMYEINASWENGTATYLVLFSK